MTSEAKPSKLPSLSENRPGKALWAPGDYLRRCHRCGKQFWGDKRSIECAPCAYGDATLSEEGR